jgi:hypothetical protein
MGRTCKLGATRAEPKQKQEYSYLYWTGGWIELDYDALAGSSGIDRFLQVCDEVLFSLLGTRECL